MRHARRRLFAAGLLLAPVLLVWGGWTVLTEQKGEVGCVARVIDTGVRGGTSTAFSMFADSSAWRSVTRTADGLWTFERAKARISSDVRHNRSSTTDMRHAVIDARATAAASRAVMRRAGADGLTRTGTSVMAAINRCIRVFATKLAPGH